MPLVVLGGSTYGATHALGGFQEADQIAFAAPGCKWTAQVHGTERIAEYLHLAMANAVGGRPGAVYLDFPAEVVQAGYTAIGNPGLGGLLSGLIER